MTRRKVMLFIADLTAGGAERVISILANTWAQDETLEVIVTVLFSSKPFYALDTRVRYVSLGMIPNAATTRRLADYVRAARGLRQLVQREQPTFVLSFMNKYNVFCLATLLGTGCPVIASERGPPNELGREFNWAMRRALYPRAAGIITQSEMSRLSLIERIGQLDVVVIHNPVMPLKGNTDVARENIVLTIGRLAPQKGQLDLLRAFAGIEAPGWRLVLCGGGPLRYDLEALASNLSISDRVEFAGVVTDIGSQFARARIFAFPSHFEGFPNALAEAMLAGLPCVSTDCQTGPAEMIRDGINGFLVPVGDVAAMTQRLRYLIAHPIAAERLGEQAAKLAREWDPPTIAARYLHYCLHKAEVKKGSITLATSAPRC